MNIEDKKYETNTISKNSQEIAEKKEEKELQIFFGNQSEGTLQGDEISVLPPPLKMLTPCSYKEIAAVL